MGYRPMLHFQNLLNPEKIGEERGFYEIETAKNSWSVRELQRQFQSSLYERLALSKDKKTVLSLVKKQDPNFFQKHKVLLRKHLLEIASHSAIRNVKCLGTLWDKKENHVLQLYPSIFL